MRAILGLAILASVAANILHAQPNLVARVIAAWSPLAVLATIELISRVPTSGWRSWVRLIPAGVIAGIAAWVSYWHMVEVATRAGESASSAHLLPVSVDGVVVVASVTLVEIAARIRAAGQPGDGSQEEDGSWRGSTDAPTVEPWSPAGGGSPGSATPTGTSSSGTSSPAAATPGARAAAAKVTPPRPPVTTRVNPSVEERVTWVMTQVDPVTRKDVMTRWGVSEETAKRDIAAAKKRTGHE